MKANTKIVHKTSSRSMKKALNLKEKERNQFKQNLKRQIAIFHSIACATEEIGVEITRRTTMLAICEELFEEYNVTSIEQLGFKNKDGDVCDHILEYYIYH